MKEKEERIYREEKRALSGEKYFLQRATLLEMLIAEKCQLINSYQCFWNL